MKPVYYIKEQMTMDEQTRHSEVLFETLNRNKKKRRRKVITTVLIVLAVVGVIGVGAVVHLRNRVQERFASAAAQVEEYTVATGSIHTLVAGSGMLTQVDLETIEVPAGVEITEVFAEAQDMVQAGDVLATVDLSTVLTSLADIQEQLDDLDDQIADAKGDTVSSYINAGVSGRVKRLFVEKGTDVTACMAQNGALALISLDGFMAVDVETQKLTKGETITVYREDGTAITGTVESVAGGKATVLVTDNGPKFDEQVTVFAADGTEAGSGKLYIHNPLAVTGYAGTVSYVSVQENTQVYGSSAICQLTNTSFSANYDTLLRSRSDLEETLMELLTIYRDGAVCAPMDGMVSSVLYDEDGEKTQTQILTLFPNEQMSITISVDETDILSLEEGQIAEVVVSSVSEETITGSVTDISKEATTASGVTTYSAEITVDILEGMLPGMTAEVDVRIEGTENALIIPVDALHQTSAIHYVYTSYDPETQQYGGMTEVTVGMQNDSYAEILTGLQEGDTIYYTEKQQNWWGFGAMGMGGGMPTGNSRPATNSSQRPAAGGPNMGGQR